jgi:hypothetical protein
MTDDEELTAGDWLAQWDGVTKIREDRGFHCVLGSCAPRSGAGCRRKYSSVEYHGTRAACFFSAIYFLCSITRSFHK